jgi:exopolysaccharide production protein ExoZ
LTGWFIGCLWFAFHPKPGLLLVYLLPVQLLFVFCMIIAVIHKKRWISQEPLLLSIGGGIVAFALYRASANRHSFEDIVAGLGCALIMAALIGLEVKGRIRVSRVWLLLGDASYSIYLIHMPFLAMMTPKAYQLHLPIVVLFCLEAGIAVMVGIALHLTVERQLLRTL